MSTPHPEFSDNDLEIFFRGYATCFDVVLTDIETLKDSLNTVMGIYMDREPTQLYPRTANATDPHDAVTDDLTRMHELLSTLTRRIDDAYFAKMDEIKADPGTYLRDDA